MALIICKECDTEFSDLAPACPKCAAPTSYSKQGIIPIEENQLDPHVKYVPQQHLQQININIPEQKEPPKQIRYIGSLLLIGIFFFPLIFYWFLLRDGHTTFARVVGFIWLLLTTLFSFVAVDSYHDYIAKSHRKAALIKEPIPTTVFQDLDSNMEYKSPTESTSLEEPQYTVEYSQPTVQENNIPNTTTHHNVAETTSKTKKSKDEEINITDSSLAECLASEAEEEGYTYKDNGESATRMLEACHNSFKIWHDQCTTLVDAGSCNLHALSLAQTELVNVGK